MYTKTVILLLFNILLIINCYDDISLLERRLKYYSNIDKLSNNTMHASYDLNNGLICVANEDVNAGGKILNIPINKTLCPYFLFPFKFDIIEALNSIPHLVSTIGKEQKFGVYVLTYYLLYIMSGPKELIKNYIKEKKLSDYYNIFEYDESIVDAFPKIILGGSTLDPDQYALLRELGYPLELEYELDMVYRTVNLHIITNSPHSEVIFPWVSNVEEFRHAYGIVMSRAMSIKINEYKLLLNINPGHLKGVEKKNFEINNYFSQNIGAPCIVTFVDLCNHYHPKYLDMRDKKPIIIDAINGYFINSVPVNYRAGEEMGFTYSNEPSDLILFLHYGFIIPKNIFNMFKVRVEDDFVFTIPQFNLCRELGCLDSSIKDPLKVPKVKLYSIRYGAVTHDLINFGRIKYIKGDVNIGKIISTLANEKPISFDNEIKAWSYYLTCVKQAQYSKLSLEKSIYKIQKYRNKRIIFEKTLDRKSSEQLKQLKRLKHFEIIYALDFNFRGIITYQQNISLNNMIKTSNNHIKDLKLKKYLKTK